MGVAAVGTFVVAMATALGCLSPSTVTSRYVVHYPHAVHVGRSLQTANITCTVACADSSVNMITKSKFPSLTVMVTARYEYDYQVQLTVVITAHCEEKGWVLWFQCVLLTFLIRVL